MLTMPKLTTLIVIFACTILSCAARAQILKNSNLNLNAGGVIYDVDYNSITKTYAVVGKFTSVNGIAVSNIFFIDSIGQISPLTTTTNTLVIFDAPITSAKFYQTPVSNAPLIPAGQYRYLYLGGFFNMVNGVSRNGLCRLNSTYLFTQPSTYYAPYKLSNWTNQLANGTRIHDIEIVSQRLVATGEIFFSATSSVCPNCYKGTFSANAITGALNAPQLAFQGPASGSDIPGDYSYKLIETDGTNFYIYSEEGLAKYSSTGVLQSSWSLNGTILPSPGSSIDIVNFKVERDNYDTLFYLNQSYFNPGAPGGQPNTGFSQEIYNNSYGIVSDGSTQYNSPVSDPGNRYFASYKNYQYHAVGFGAASTCGSNPNALIPGGSTNPSQTSGRGYLKTYRRNDQNSLSLTNIHYLSDLPFPAVTSYDYFSNFYSQRLIVAGNRLFVSGENLDSVNCLSAQKAAYFCLEPRDPENFTDFDLSICDGNVRTYTIPKTEFANGYRWQYSGTGARFRLSGSSGGFIALSDTIISDVNANSIEIEFQAGTTPGNLSVTPFSLCNTTTDYQFSNSQSLTLTLAPPPNLSVFDTLSLNCYSDTAIISASSLNPGATFEWNYNGSVSNGDTVLVINDGMNTIVDSIYYVATVTEPLNGCKASDSTFFFVDTIAAPIAPAAFSTSPATFNCLTDSMQLIANVPGATVEWSTQASNPTYTYGNPHTIYTSDTLIFWGYATYLSNGCRSQAQILIPTNFATAQGALIGFPGFSGGDIVDTISCFSDSLSLISTVTAPYNGTASAEWIINGIPSTDTLLLSIEDSLGMNAFNLNIYTFRTTHAVSGCTTDVDALVAFDLDKPFVFESTTAPTLNCSQDSVLLSHQTTVGNVTQGWLDFGGLQTGNNAIYAASPGNYIYQVQSNTNGCLNTDTTTVSNDLTLLIDLTSDTLICPNEQISVVATPINNNESHTYLWSNGTTSNGIDLIGGIDSIASVIVQTPSGCIGYDTVNVAITLPIVAFTSGLTGCVGGVLQIDSVSGGAGNYTFSVDGTNWQSNSSFDNLSFGEHTILVQDDLGCIYTFIDTIDLYDAGIEMNFLVSTYNAVGDSVVLVNITNFSGFDSVAWTAPPGANIYFTSDSILELSINQLGWFDLTLTGYVDTCYYSFTKSVYFGDSKPDFDGNQSSLGIQSVLLTPNPTTGIFAVDAVLGTEQHYSFIVTNLNGQPLNGMSTSGIGKNISLTFEFPLGTPAGSYLLHVVTDFDADSFVLILN